jgi:hypothetical protein
MHGSVACIKAFQVRLSTVEAVDLKFTLFQGSLVRNVHKEPPIFVLPKVLVPLEAGLVEIWVKLFSTLPLFGSN